MSSILITIVEGSFKLLELRRGKMAKGEQGKGKEKQRRRRKEVKIGACLTLEKDHGPRVRLNKDDTNGFNCLNYYLQIQLLLFGLPHWE